MDRPDCIVGRWITDKANGRVVAAARHGRERHRRDVSVRVGADQSGVLAVADRGTSTGGRLAHGCVGRAVGVHGRGRNAAQRNVLDVVGEL